MSVIPSCVCEFVNASVQVVKLLICSDAASMLLFCDSAAHRTIFHTISTKVNYAITHGDNEVREH